MLKIQWMKIEVRDGSDPVKCDPVKCARAKQETRQRRRRLGNAVASQDHQRHSNLLFR